MEFGTNCHNVKFRGVWEVADDREEAERLPVVHGDESRAPIGDASVLLIRFDNAEPMRHSHQERSAGRAASLLKPDEPHRATIAHRSTTAGVDLPRGKRGCTRSRRSGTARRRARSSPRPSDASPDVPVLVVAPIYTSRPPLRRIPRLLRLTGRDYEQARGRC